MGVNWFLEPVVENGGSGSGSIIDPSGYVVTNVHVISDASKIYISLSDGTQYEGKVIGSDPESDIAVLKFTPPEGTVLKTIDFGNSDELKVGQKVNAKIINIDTERMKIGLSIKDLEGTSAEYGYEEYIKKQ